MTRTSISGNGGGGGGGDVTIVPDDRIHRYSRGDPSGQMPVTYIGYTVPVGKALDIENWHFSGEGKGLMVMDVDDGNTEYEIDSIRIEDDTESHRFTASFGINTPLSICAGSTIRLRLRSRENKGTEYITGFNAVLRDVTSCTEGATGGQLSGLSGESGGGGSDSSSD